MDLDQLTFNPWVVGSNPTRLTTQPSGRIAVGIWSGDIVGIRSVDLDTISTTRVAGQKTSAIAANTADHNCRGMVAGVVMGGHTGIVWRDQVEFKARLARDIDHDYRPH